MISIKPHHFVDIITVLGAGGEAPQPHPYGHAVHSVTREILANRDVELRMVFGADDICRPCCHHVHGLCDDTIDVSFRPKAPASKGEYNVLIDQRWADRLALREGDIVTAREMCRRIRDLAGDITDIYRETPPDRTRARHRKLMQGVATFIG